MNEWLTPKEVATLLKVSRVYVDYLIKGRLRKLKNRTYTTPPVFTNLQKTECAQKSHYLIHYRELEKLR
jgi:hypothetical protein